MDQDLALRIMERGESVFLTGPAGSGKTYVLNDFIRRAKSTGKKIAVTATTGLAATHLGGSTIHSWSGIGIHEVLPNNFFAQLPKGRRENIEKTDVLIIDEISMLHDYRLDLVDEVLRNVRKSEAPFGGVQVILCGDFFQLPPVNRGESTGGFVVDSLSWHEMQPVICYLAEQHRQDDTDFLSILTALRQGDIRRHHAESLLARVDVDLEQDTITELHTTNINVDRINQQHLERLSGDEVSFTAETTGSANYVENLKRSCLAPEVLRLKKGALVMAIKNHPMKFFANGSIGQVVDFEKGTLYPIVKFRSGKQVTLMPDTWELRDGDKKRAGLSQIPLRLAWAITVHKSQGMTLDVAKIDLRRAFVEGMGYVALSRVRDLDSLSLAGINQMALKVSPKALEIDEMLQKSSAKATKRFIHLKDEPAQKNATQDTQKKTNWAEKIEKMRLEYPNAYRPWKKEDDDLLKERFQQGNSVKELSKLLGRHEGSIKIRLQKHFGEDVVQT